MKRELEGYKKIAGKHINLSYDNLDKEIDKIIVALDLIIEDDIYGKDHEKKQELIDEGLQALAKNFQRLWW